MTHFDLESYEHIGRIMKNIKKFFLLLVGAALLPLCFVEELSAAEKVNPSNQTRQYPGGRDEEDLKVQEELRTPTATLDRRTIEQKVLKNYLKKPEEKSPTQKKSN